MSTLLVSLFRESFFTQIYKTGPSEINILDEAFILVSLDPAFRIVTIKNLLKLVYILNTKSQLHLKDKMIFNETYVHSTYKLMEYLQNEIFAGFMIDVLEDQIKSFE